MCNMRNVQLEKIFFLINSDIKYPEYWIELWTFLVRHVIILSHYLWLWLSFYFIIIYLGLVVGGGYA